MGDAAIVPNFVNGKEQYSPPTAQFAVRQAKNLAKNIILKSENKNLRKFEYTSKGSLASLGSKIGVAGFLFLLLKVYLAGLFGEFFI